MLIGVSKEGKNHEYRVGITPVGVNELVQHGHEVLIQKGAGLGSSITDDEFVSQGAQILDSADDVWGEADMVLKVKEPIAKEWGFLRKELTVFTYFHFAADEALTKAHLASGATCIAYETVELPNRELPLLTPMSEVAGRMSVQEGAKFLEAPQLGSRGRRKVDGIARLGHRRIRPSKNTTPSRPQATHDGGVIHDPELHQVRPKPRLQVSAIIEPKNVGNAPCHHAHRLG